jgi:hypothetical protein
MVSRYYYPKFPNLKSAIVNYYRTKCFKLDIKKYLFREKKRREELVSQLKLASLGDYEINVSTQHNTTGTFLNPFPYGNMASFEYGWILDIYSLLVSS